MTDFARDNRPPVPASPSPELQQRKSEVCPNKTATIGEPQVKLPPAPRQNSANQFDVNNDGKVSVMDALALINYLNSPESQIPISAKFFPDVNGDNKIDAEDVLYVVQRLNETQSFVESKASPQEGEKAPQVLKTGHGK